MADQKSNLAFERLVQPHFERLYRLSFRLCGSKAPAEDLFQELLIKAYGKLDELVTIDEPGAWLSRVLYNLFVDEHRRFKRQRVHLVDEGHLPGEGIAGLPGSSSPDVEAERDEAFHHLDAALSQISDEHRIIVLLHDTEGYKLSEIQELMGVPVGTIKSRLHRARARLKEILVSDGTLL